LKKSLASPKLGGKSPNWELWVTSPPLKPALLLMSTVLMQGAFGNCLDSAAVGQIGTQPPCTGMLIVDSGMLYTAKNNGSYAITGPDNNIYTFGDSQYNVYTGQVTSLLQLFKDTTFNGDIGYWDVSNVTSFRGMFQFNGVFNQDLSGWNVTDKATILRGMFNHSGAADQDFSGWDISNVTDFFAAFTSDHSRWSPANYDATLNGWNQLPGASGKTIFARAFYTSAATTARDDLLAKNWAFSSDSFTTDTTPPSLSSSPTNDAIGVPTDSNITLSFNEDVTWLGNSTRANNNIVELIRSDDDVVIETFSVGTRPTDSSFTLTPSSDLEESTNYHIKIRPNTFYDTSNNSYPGISDNTTLTFRTAPEAQSIQFAQPADDLITSISATLFASASSGLTVAYGSNTPTVCSATGDEVTYIAVGTCTITASQAGDATYLAAPDVTRSLEISKDTQTITFAQPADDLMTSGGVALVASASSGLTPTYVSITPSVCTVVTNQVSYVSSGTCTITASQAGNNTYLRAPDSTRSFEIRKATQEITFNQPADGVVTSGGVTLVASASSDLTVTYTSTTPGVCTVDGAQLTFVTFGTCTIIASQPGNNDYASALDIERSFDVADGDSDGDGILNSADEFFLAITETVTHGVSLQTTPAKTNSSCSIESFTLSSVANEFPNVAIAGTGIGISLTLSGCDTSDLETLIIQINLDQPVAQGSVPINIDASNKWLEITGATIEGSSVVYPITDNGPLDQATEAGKVLHLMTIAMPVISLPVPTLEIWAALLLVVLLAFAGYRRLPF
jgi:hypothetical protein